MKKIPAYLIVCVFIIVIACIPRAIELVCGNYVFGFDQGKHWLGAKALIVDHKIPLIGDEVGGARGFFQGPGWIYTLSVFYFLFAGNPYGGIVLMFVSGIATVALALWLFGKTLGKLEAGCIGVLLAISPILIESSRLTWPPHMIPPLTIISLYALLKMVSGAYRYLPALFFVIALMGHFEIATAGTMTIALLVYVIPFVIIKKIPWKIVLLSVLAWCIPFLPLIVFDIRHQFINIKGIMETFAGDRQIQSSLTLLIANHRMIFATNIFHAFQTMFISYIAVVGLLIIGVFQLIDKKVAKTKRQFLFFLYFFPLILFGVLLLYKNDLWPWWLYELSVVMVVCVGMSVSWMMRKKGLLRIFAIAVLLFMFVGYAKESIRFWRNDYPNYGGTAKIRGKTDAFDFIFQDAKTKDFGLFFFTPPVYTYSYDFLNWWYGKKTYGYIPPQEKKAVFYLLAEPDSEKPWTYKGWMETAIVGGTVVDTWTLPSGFIVQKRVMTE